MNLVLSTRVVKGHEDVGIFLGIKNIGRGSAKAPYLAFTIPEPFRLAQFGLDGNGREGLPKLPRSGQMYRYGANSTFVIHPSTVHEVAKLDLGFGLNKPSVPTGTVIIEYEITAEDSQIIRSSKSIDLDSVIQE